MTIKKLTAMPYAQAHIEKDDNNSVSLFSYVTRVAELTHDGWLTIFGLYSQTTRRHISAFLKEYAQPINYQTAKQLFQDDLKINIFTGEITEVRD